jgi:hypothetical protein
MRRVGGWLALALLLIPGAALAQTRPQDVRPRGRALDFESPPSTRPARDLALEQLRAAGRAAGLTGADLDEVIVTSEVRTQRNGATHLYLRQRLHGLDVLGTEATATVAADGRVIGAHQRFADRLAARADATEPQLSAAEAVAFAAESLGLELRGPLPELAPPRGIDRATLLEGGGISLDPIPARLVYVRTPADAIRLAWDVVLRLPDGQHWWSLRVDAETGEILDRSNWIDTDSYRVFALGLDGPSEGPRTLEVDPATGASPFGWHDTNGAAGAEFTDTRGNNAFAQEDANANNSGGFRPSGGAGLAFDFPLDLGQPPATQQAPAITNLFYWNNVLHDFFYAYGFDEVAGNFQENNYGNGGVGSDPVNADAQDGTGFNNANFATPADGQNPRMQMYLFQWPGVTISAPAGIAGAVEGGLALFGPPVTTTPVAGSLVQALDPATGTLPSATDACSPLTNAPAVAGNIALIDRGECNFTVKVSNAQNAGAIAAVVVNNQGNALVDMSGTDPTITIPSIFLGQDNGERIEAELAGGVNGSLSVVTRDGSFDNGIVIHEYGHGVSNRLTGGPANVSCLDLVQPSGMGEGWSDFFALALTHDLGDTRDSLRPLGTFATGHLGPPRTAPGIRNYPYTTDLAENPQTYADIETTNQPHGVGEVWAVALWEMYWNLVDRWGFDTDVFFGTAGNNLALELVTDAMKLQSCEPSFLDARDALLQADNLNNAGANQCRIWRAFARRGMGENADAGLPNPATPDVTEDFGIPAACAATCGNQLIEADEVCDGSQAGACTAGCNSQCFCLADADGDGLDDALETTLGTNPLVADTDGDGFSDGHEVNVLGSDPLDPNSPAAPAVPSLPPGGPLLVALLLGLTAHRALLAKRTER